MLYPKLKEISATREMLEGFKGYNHNLKIAENEFYDTKNLSSDNYPLISPRKKRGVYQTTNDANGMCSNTDFCYVDGRYIHIGNDKVDLSLTQGVKNLVNFGSNVIILPDQKYINTINYADRGHAKQGVYDLPEQAQDSAEPAKVVFTLVSYSDSDEIYNTLLDKSKGNKVWVGAAGVSAEEAEDRGDYLFYATANYVPPSGWKMYSPCKAYNSDEIVWQPYGSTYWAAIGVYVLCDDEEYTKVVLNSIASAITDNPAVKITGTTTDLDSLTGVKVKVGEGIIRDRESGDEVILRNGLVIYQTEHINLDAYQGYADAGLLVRDGQAIAGTWSPLEVSTPISITAPYNANSATIPVMDFVIESGNRLWGCRYGYNNEGNFVNEIYASALGDFKVWNKIDGTSTDSYAASVGTSGAFTGAISYGGYPIFFKEDCIHKVYGNYPANYQIQTTMCRGVQKGSEKSLAIVNEILYYKSRTGVCAYDGSLPVEVSSQLGDVAYFDAVAGGLGNKYYISMRDESGEYNLFVYDTRKNIWHREDNTQTTQFCSHKGDLFYIDYADNHIKSVKGTGITEDTIDWSATTGILGASLPDNKYVSRLDVRLMLSVGARVSFYIEYDSIGEWEHLFTMDGVNLKSFTVPVRPNRCDHFRLKLIGRGEAKIFSICKTIEGGKDT